MKQILLIPSVLIALTSYGQAPGSMDLSFNAADLGFGLGDGTNNSGIVQGMARQSDGKVVIVGNFGWHNGNTVGGLSRMNADGTRDATFQNGQIVNGQVFAVAVLSDGKILIGGFFSSVNGVQRYRIARLNSNGTLDTSFDPGTGPVTGTYIYAIAPQPDGTVVIGGIFTTIGGVARRNIARLLPNGSVDLTFDPGQGALSEVYALRNTSSARVLVGGAFTAFNGVPRGGIARLNSNGSLDPSFASGTGIDLGRINTVVERFDGRIYVGGTFTQFDGVERKCVARLLANGTVDPAYGGATGPDLSTTTTVHALVEQPDGSLLVGGQFTSVGGTPKPYLAKFSNTGTLDPAYPIGSGPNGIVYSMLLRPDGKALIGGAFPHFGERTALGYTLLNTDGSMDLAFDPGSGCNGGSITKLVVQPNERIIALGSFAGYNGAKRPNLLRLLPNGTLDNSFMPGLPSNGTMASMALAPDGKVLVAGAFTAFAGHTTAKVARLNSNGSVDASFTVSGINNSVVGITVQSDGKVLIGGSFTTVQGVPRNRIARLLANGSLDISFDPGTGPDNLVYDVQLTADGKVVLVGNFTAINGVSRNRVARLNADGSVDTTLDPGTGANALVEQAVLLPDGKFFIRGNFSTYNGIARTVIARVNTNGTLDQTFDPGVVTSELRAVVPCPDGRVILAGGTFIGIAGTTLYGLGRLLPDGSIDPGFVEGTGIDRSALCAALTGSGQVLVAGIFFAYNGIGRNRIARIHNGVTPMVTVRPRVFLDGPFNSTTNLLSDQLRTQQLLPFTEPYTALGYAHVGGGGGESVLPAVVNPGGNNTMVDWVVVELRDANTPGLVLASRSAVLQRDGDVVGTNGVSPVAFTFPAGNYRIALRHRNHLGCMTALPLALSLSSTTINFTNPATTTWGTDARKNNNGTMTLWPGDANSDGEVRYTGAGNDRDPVLQAIGGSVPTNVLNAVYSRNDVNLDGLVRYTGTTNDRDIILQTIGGLVPTAVRMEQLP